MADTPVGLILEAKDEASAVLNKVSGNVLSLHHVLTELATTGGPIGLVAVAITAIGGAGVAAATHLTETVVQLERMARITGVSTDQLQVWRRVIEGAGGDPDVLTTALVRLNRALGDNNPTVRALGLNTKNTGAAFMELMGLLSHTDKQNATAISFQLLGRSAKDMQADWEALVTQSGSVEEAIKRVHAFVSPETAEKTKPLHAAILALKDAWKGFANVLGEIFLPLATVVMNVLGALIAPIASLLKAVGEGVARMGDAVGQYLTDTLTDAKTFEEYMRDKAPPTVSNENDPRMHTFRKRDLDAGSATDTSDQYAIGVSATRKHVPTQEEIAETEKRRKALVELAAEFRATGESASDAAQDAARFYDYVKNGTDLAAKGLHDLRTMTLGKEMTAEVEATEKRAADLRITLGLSAGAAYAMAAGLKYAADEAKRLSDIKATNADLYDSVERAVKLAEAFGATRREATMLREQMLGIFMGPVADGQREQAASLQSWADAMKRMDDAQQAASQRQKMAPALYSRDANLTPQQRASLNTQLNRDAMNNIRESTEAMLTQAALINDAFGTVQSSLQNSWSTMFQRFTDKTQTFKGAWNDIWHQLVNDTLAELGRLSELWIMRAVLEWAMPGSTTGTWFAASLVGGGGGGPHTVQHVNVNVSTLDTRSAAQAFGSPRSEVRAAMRQLGRERAF